MTKISNGWLNNNVSASLGEIHCASLSVGKKTSKYFYTVELKLYDFTTKNLNPSDCLVFKDEFSYISESDLEFMTYEVINYVFENKDKIQNAIDEYNLRVLNASVKFSDLQRHWNQVGAPVLIKE